tara:strand:- start:3557 stop:4204 length:648 start_codon:yes stop_codon:yes gene_type:complete
MSFTYTELQDAIKNFTENEETSFVSNLPLFIRSAEDRILTVVDLEFFRKNATSQSTIGDPYLSVPADYLSSFSMQITTANYKNFLELKDVNYLQEYNNSIGSQTTPKYYGIFDVDNFILSPTPNLVYDVELHYYYRPASITAGAGSGTTWLSENAPNSLLYGSLVEAYTYMKGEQDMMQLYEQRFVQEIQRLKDLAEARENSDAYRRGLPDRPRT